MSNSTSNLDLISASQAQKEVTANAMLDAASPAMLFGRRASTTAALTWGYYGGTILVGGAPTQIANGTVALTASATNYVEATTAGVVSANTTAFTAGRAKLYTVVTGAATVTSYTDQRTPAGGGSAVDITNTPAGNIAATNVQAALNELDAEKALLAGSSTQDFAAKILTTSADASIQGVTVGRGGGAHLVSTLQFSYGYRHCHYHLPNRNVDGRKDARSFQAKHAKHSGF